MPSLDSPLDARDGAAVSFYPGRARQRQVVFPDGDDLAAAQLLPLDFSVAFTDADPESNRVLNECEEWLFFNPSESEISPLGSLIRKTELQGEL